MNIPIIVTFLIFVFVLTIYLMRKDDNKRNVKTNDIHISNTVLVPRLSKVNDSILIENEEIAFSSVPDQPLPFCYKCAWIAIRTEETEAILRESFFCNVQTTSWKYGLNRAMYLINEVFITPPISGWTFIVGCALPEISNSKWELLINDLGKRFEEVQYYNNNRTVDYYAWAKFVRGEATRVFEYIDCSVSIDRGEILQDEKLLGIYLPSSDATQEEWDEKAVIPDEEHVLKMAGYWSLDPREIENMKLPDSTGTLAEINYRKIS